MEKGCREERNSEIVRKESRTSCAQKGEAEGEAKEAGRETEGKTSCAQKGEAEGEAKEAGREAEGEAKEAGRCVEARKEEASGEGPSSTEAVPLGVIGTCELEARYGGHPAWQGALRKVLRGGTQRGRLSSHTGGLLATLPRG